MHLFSANCRHYQRADNDRGEDTQSHNAAEERPAGLSLCAGRGVAVLGEVVQGWTRDLPLCAARQATGTGLSTAGRQHRCECKQAGEVGCVGREEGAGLQQVCEKQWEKFNLKFYCNLQGDYRRSEKRRNTREWERERKAKRVLPENLVLRPYHNDYFESM